MSQPNPKAPTLAEEFQGLQPSSNVLGIQLWHLVAIIIFGICILLTVLCCFLEWRIPRTRKEIELDRQLRKMADEYAEQMMDKMKVEEHEMDNKENKVTVDHVPVFKV